MRMTEPISQGLIQPFINRMLEELHVTPDRTHIGFYAGLITSLFALCQLCTTFWWGRLSDRIGRKPILLIGLTGLSISIISFGLQTSFIGLVISRCLAGVMNGNVAVIRSVLAEITDDTNKARAFALLPMTAALGTIVGPVMGGYLAQPAEQYPNLFGNITFLKNYPYFLPCFVAGSTNALAVLLGFIFLEETLESKQTKKEEISSLISDQEEGFSPINDQISNGPPSLRDLFTPTVLTVLFSFLFLALQNSAWATLVPLFSYTRLEDGGLGLSMNQIGTALSINGFVAVAIQMGVFPMLQRRLGTLRLFRSVLLFMPLSFMLLPVVRWIALRSTESNGPPPGASVALWGLICVLAIKSLTGMAMVCISLLLNAAAPSKSSFGALNGLGQSCSALARTLGPASTGAIFAISINKHYLGGNLIWVVTIIVCACTCLTSWRIRVDASPVKKSLKNVSPSTM
ncbi:major facilitator superfamily domain-containing protein [Melampsora americana]|nr:major facilitator superfamily domain-containing protein [Melampsora americana]